MTGVNYVYGCDGETAIDYYFNENIFEQQLNRLLDKGMISYSNWDGWIIRAFSTEEDSPGFYLHYLNNEGIIQREAIGELMWGI